MGSAEPEGAPGASAGLPLTSGLRREAGMAQLSALQVECVLGVLSSPMWGRWGDFGEIRHAPQASRLT